MYPHRKPSRSAREAMSDSALVLGTEYCCIPNHGETKEALRDIKDVTGHRYARLVSSGNAAILSVLKAINGSIALPDQGGWKAFKDFQAMFGQDVFEIKTDMGIVDPADLDRELKRLGPKAFCVPSFAGYIAEQDIKEISRVCRENGVMLVEDASGAIGDSRLAKGKYSDVIVCSTGTPKILNLLSGGFFTTSRRQIMDDSIDIVKTCKMSPATAAGLIEELKDAGKLIDRLVGYSDILKEMLGDVADVVHADRRGICTGFRHPGPIELAKRAKENGMVTDFGRTFLTTCPRYERFLEYGIVVELKKLDVMEIDEVTIEEIGKTLKMCQK